MFGSSSLLVFVDGAVTVWVAGIRLSETTDVLSERLGLDEALGASYSSPSSPTSPRSL